MNNNTELPKEVVEKIAEAVSEKYWDVDDRSKSILFSDGARMAQSHYEPLLEAKDKEIAKLKKLLAEEYAKYHHPL